MNKSFMIRIINRKRLLILFVVTIIINILDFYGVNNEITYIDRFPLQSAWNMNMAVVGSFRFGGIMYMFLVFFLSSLPLSDVLVEDKNSGILNQILLKIDKRSYLKSVYINNFIYGGIFALFPLFINLILWMMIRPLFSMNFISGNLSGMEFLSRLFVTNTLLFFLIHFFIVFLIGGMISSLSLIINDKLNNVYVGGLVVLTIDIIISILCLIYSDMTNSYLSLIGLRESIINRVFPRNLFSLIYLFIVLVTPLIYVHNKIKKEDIV